MKVMNLMTLFCLCGLWACSSSDEDSQTDVNIITSPTEISVGYGGEQVPLHVTCEREWTLYSDNEWIVCTKHPADPLANSIGNASVNIAANTLSGERAGTIVIKSGSNRVTIPVKQTGKPEEPVNPDIQTPDGYKLVWHDEFDVGKEPDAGNWKYETGGGGWGNNELQHYVKCYQGNEQLAVIKEGILQIIAKKIDGTVYSIRMNSAENWKYGYFEARLKLPKGKGTWPAFWMMPKNYTSWPEDGEIDIMEQVGYHPNYVSSTIHCKSYNHSIGTEKTRETFIATAQEEFHVYALEWTEDFIRTFVDGNLLFSFENDKKGNKDTWPFDAPFYLKLNLAWGGNWGGAQGVDETCLPATYEIDYVRVFQKK